MGVYYLGGKDLLTHTLQLLLCDSKQLLQLLQLVLQHTHKDHKPKLSTPI